MKVLKIMAGIILTLLMTILPARLVNADTFSSNNTVSYVFQDTDGQPDVVYCDRMLTQDYTKVSSTNYIYGRRYSYFGFREFGAKGVNVWAVPSPDYRNQNGTVHYTFSDWTYQPVVVTGGTTVLYSYYSTAVHNIFFPNYTYGYNYSIGGTDFWIFPQQIVNDSFRINISQ